LSIQFSAAFRNHNQDKRSAVIFFMSSPFNLPFFFFFLSRPRRLLARRSPISSPLSLGDFSRCKHLEVPLPSSVCINAAEARARQSEFSRSHDASFLALTAFTRVRLPSRNKLVEDVLFFLLVLCSNLHRVPLT